MLFLSLRQQRTFAQEPLVPFKLLLRCYCFSSPNYLLSSDISLVLDCLSEEHASLSRPLYSSLGFRVCCWTSTSSCEMGHRVAAGYSHLHSDPKDVLDSVPRPCYLSASISVSPWRSPDHALQIATGAFPMTPHTCAPLVPCVLRVITVPTQTEVLWPLG